MKPCTRCGNCCRDEVCPVALGLGIPDIAPCPAVVFKGTLAACGIITDPVKHIPSLTETSDEQKEWLGQYLKDKIMNFGYGCDSDYSNDIDESSQPMPV